MRLLFVVSARQRRTAGWVNEVAWGGIRRRKSEEKTDKCLVEIRKLSVFLFIDLLFGSDYSLGFLLFS